MSTPIRTWSLGSVIRPTWSRIRANGTRDFRRLTGLLAQPLAALAGSGYPRAGMALLRAGRAGGPHALGPRMGAGRGQGHGPYRARACG